MCRFPMFNPECRRRHVHLSDLDIAGVYKIGGSDIEPNGGQFVIRPFLSLSSAHRATFQWRYCSIWLAGVSSALSTTLPVFATVSSSSFTTTFPGLGNLTHWNRISLCVATWPGTGAPKIALSGRTFDLVDAEALADGSSPNVLSVAKFRCNSRRLTISFRYDVRVQMIFFGCCSFNPSSRRFKFCPSMPFTRHLISQPSVLHCPFSFWHCSPKILAPPSSTLPTTLMHLQFILRSGRFCFCKLCIWI
ncbi:hypothetical protein GYMLUDRAFT_916708 [Collybiopsis luxurians FD-317 M1]|uniref:Uncharacterized protein n=1 Tax=Collybiopsis luxurians FD-317 M1 TaxID=944289 RepID=A0A0D0CH19_9AGAR|nr:hypothetical protein GYMLUDRAFT_916708 [Collybiopsis luxurians FD-317 M1]